MPRSTSTQVGEGASPTIERYKRDRAGRGTCARAQLRLPGGDSEMTLQSSDATVPTARINKQG